jgi:mannitol/fructose-specific phosphotransferase system IIA component (Ntr-type)
MALLLTDYIDENHIRLNFVAAGKTAAVSALCRFAAELHGLDYDKTLKVVMEREERGSTGLGGGVALPHGRLPDLEKPALVMVIAPQGVEMDSLDRQPVHLLVLILTPETGDGREHLAILARLGSLLKQPSAVAELLAADSPAEVYRLLARRDGREKKTYDA